MNQFKKAVKTLATEYIRYEIECHVGNDDDEMKKRILDEAELSRDACYALIHNSGFSFNLISELDEWDNEAINTFYKIEVDGLYDHVYEIKMEELYELKMNESYKTN
jgi:hypothetical protein